MNLTKAQLRHWIKETYAAASHGSKWYCLTQRPAIQESDRTWHIEECTRLRFDPSRIFAINGKDLAADRLTDGELITEIAEQTDAVWHVRHPA